MRAPHQPFLRHRLTHDDHTFTVFIMEPFGHGFVRLNVHLEDEPTAAIFELSVTEEHRKNGLGRALLDECERIARENGCVRIALWVEKDQWMRGWYERCGYEVYQDHETKPTAVWMNKDLPLPTATAHCPLPLPPAPAPAN